MPKPNAVEKIREHLKIVKSCALMMAHTQTAAGRNEFLKRLSEQLKSAEKLLAKIEAD